MKISVMLHNFRQPLEASLETANRLGVDAVQISLGPDSDAHAMAKAVAAAGLGISAISCDVGDLGQEDYAAKVEAAKKYIDLAAEVGQGICQTHVGVMPRSASGPRWDNFVRAGAALAEYAVTRNACVALETGPEPASVMEKLMRSVDSPGYKVNFDPANLIIWPAVFAINKELREHAGIADFDYNREAAIAEFEPVEGVRRLAPFIAHTHAKDGIGNGGWEDVPLGTGWVDWPRYLTLLHEHGYDGYLTIEREGGEDREGEIGHGVRFLREQLKTLGL